MAEKTSTGITRKRARLTSEHLKRALAMVAGGKVPGAGVEYADEGCPGLALRVTPRVAAWYLRLRTKTVRIGDADTLTVPAAREAAMRARVDLADGKNPKRDLAVFAHAMAKTGDVEIAADAAWPEEAPEQSDDERREYGPWQVRDLIDQFLLYKKEALDPDYFPLYERYLRHDAFVLIARREVRSLRIEDLERVRSELLKGAKSAAKRSTDQFKHALTWAWEDEVTRSGLKVDYPWWTRWKVRYTSDTREHTPTVDELARTLALAERHRTLGQTEHATSPGTLAMLWALVFTAQRTFALSRTEASAMVPWDNGNREGWWTMGWGRELTKSKMPHGLPLPPRAKEVLDRILEEHHSKKGPSRWLFPSIRGDGPVSPNSVNQLLGRLAGTGNSGEPIPGREDLLANHGIRRWIPHDTRRALTTYLGDHDLGGSASAILDHTMSKSSDERVKTAAVTRLHYDRAQRMTLKAAGMELWVDAVLEAYEREKAALDALPAPEMKPRTRRAA